MSLLLRKTFVQPGFGESEFVSSLTRILIQDLKDLKVPFRKVKTATLEKIALFRAAFVVKYVRIPYEKFSALVSDVVRFLRSRYNPEYYALADRTEFNRRRFMTDPEKRRAASRANASQARPRARKIPPIFDRDALNRVTAELYGCSEKTVQRARNGYLKPLTPPSYPTVEMVVFADQGLRKDTVRSLSNDPTCDDIFHDWILENDRRRAEANV